MSLRCIIILGVFVCHAHAALKSVDCEKYPFHITCRGMQTRKRFMNNGNDNDDCGPDRDCLDSKERAISNRYDSIPKSKLWITLLDGGLNTDAIYDAYANAYERQQQHRNKNVRHKDKYQRRIPQLRDFLSDLEAFDDDY